MMSDRIEQKLDKIIEKQTEHTASLAVHEELHRQNSQDLTEHIRRTNLLEEKLKPVEKHVQAVNTILKVIGFIASLAGLLTIALKLIGKI